MLAETNRTPFDLPEAEAELVSGYNIEYSSLAFAFFFLAEYSNILIISLLFVILFFGDCNIRGSLICVDSQFIETMVIFLKTIAVTISIV